MTPDLMQDGGETVDSVEQRVEQHPLVELLGNKSQVKILVALLDAPQPMNPHDIAESAAISRNAFYDNRDALEAYGVLEQVGTAGNSPLYALADDELVETIRKCADLAGARRRDQ